MNAQHDAAVRHLRGECERRICTLLTRRAGNPGLTRKDKMNISRAKQMYLEMTQLYDKWFQDRSDCVNVIPQEHLAEMSIYG